MRTLLFAPPAKRGTLRHTRPRTVHETHLHGFLSRRRRSSLRPRPRRNSCDRHATAANQPDATVRGRLKMTPLSSDGATPTTPTRRAPGRRLPPILPPRRHSVRRTGRPPHLVGLPPLLPNRRPLTMQRWTGSPRPVAMENRLLQRSRPEVPSAALRGGRRRSSPRISTVSDVSATSPAIVT